MAPLESLQKCNRFGDIVIDNFVFRLHYKVTLPIILIFCLFVACLQCFGRPIDCLPIEKIPPEFINSYCYTHSTYGTEEFWAGVIEEKINFPEVSTLHPEESRTFYSYYQWVSIFLFLQAIICYFPRYFWKRMESGRMTKMVELLKHDVESELLMNSIFASSNRNWKYFLCYSVAEVSNVLCDFLQMFFMSVFLGKEYNFYGYQVIRFAILGGPDEENPSNRIFPKVTMCTYHPPGVSDSTEPYDTTCLLPMNVIYEKIYLFLWFWFILLGVMSCIVVVYRAAMCLSNRLRILKLNTSLVDKDQMAIILKKLTIGDWFVIYLLFKNLSTLMFRDFILIVVRQLEDTDSNH